MGWLVQMMFACPPRNIKSIILLLCHCGSVNCTNMMQYSNTVDVSAQVCTMLYAVMWCLTAVLITALFEAPSSWYCLRCYVSVWFSISAHIQRCIYTNAKTNNVKMHIFILLFCLIKKLAVYFACPVEIWSYLEYFIQVWEFVLNFSLMSKI